MPAPVTGPAEAAPPTDCLDPRAQVPANPVDGTEFVCPVCGCTATFVVLDDGLPGEWVL